ncbi:hypothetical protein K438DRAFT_296567 [Mycena galopus ATCC 62051]|nr:hypothetical protein K438DRAFT_296567 [Mycena galopus ATCC 62051]
MQEFLEAVCCNPHKLHNLGKVYYESGLPLLLSFNLLPTYTTMADSARTHNPSAIPLPNQKTRVVCVLGPSNLDDDENESIVADFALLYDAFGGTAASETWLTSQNLHQDAENQGERQILHGCIPQPSRVVFNEDTPRFYSVVADPFEAFDKLLRNVVPKAKRDERIIVIICAHGSRYDDSVHLGRRMFSKARMQGILCQSKAPITIISTACHSGLWAVPHRALSKLFSASTGNQLGTLPEVYREGMVEKVIDINPFASTGSTRATSPFSDFADSVASNIHIPQCDKDVPLATILGLRDKVALLYRLCALRELPPKPTTRWFLSALNGWKREHPPVVSVLQCWHGCSTIGTHTIHRSSTNRSRPAIAAS